MDSSDSPEQDRVQPDIFAFYSHGIEELLLEEDYFLPRGSNASEVNSKDGGGKVLADCGNGDTKRNTFPCSRSLFDSAIDSGLSEFKRERLKSLLRQSVIELTREVDEMVGPVQRMHHLRERLKDERQKWGHLGDLSNGDAMQPQFKKLKTSSTPSPISIPGQASPHRVGSCKEASGSKPTESKFSETAATEKKNSSVIAKKCTCCKSTDTSKSICSACGATRKGEGESPLLPIRENDENDMEEDGGDWQFLLQSDSSEVDKMVQKYSDELLSNLAYMEQHLEKLLDTAMSKCRPMTRQEKQQLQKLIKKLPPDNLDRVAEIIGRNKPSELLSSDEILVDLEKEDNLTLWRLYAYVQAVEKAKELSTKTPLKWGRHGLVNRSNLANPFPFG